MITRYLYRNPGIVWLLVLTIIVAGAACLFLMPRLEDPILRRRVAVISTTLPGANPAEIESSVTIPVERMLEEFHEIKQVRSNTRSNISNVVVELKDEINNTDSVWSSIENRLQASENELPTNASTPELDVFPLKACAAIVALLPEENGNLEPFQLRRLARELRARILSLMATETVDLYGDPGEEVTVEFQLETLAATGLSTGSVAQQIKDAKVIPAGNQLTGDLKLTFGVNESDDLITRLEALEIQLPNQRDLIPLGNLADIKKQTLELESTACLINGEPAIALGVMVNNQSRVDLWADELEQLIVQFETDFQANYAIKKVFMQSEHVEQRMTTLTQNLGLSALAVIIIVFIFMGWRSMIVVALSLPLAACMVICGLSWLTIPIHQMSVTGLIVALGLLIDNSIVMVEEVRSRVFAGRPAIDAINETLNKLGMPLLGSTLTTILAFLPIATMAGPAGEFVGSIAISVILAIASSFLLAVTIVPPLVIFLGVNSDRKGLVDYGIRFSFLESIYRFSLRWTFRFPVLGVLIGIALPATGFYFSSQLARQFFPTTDRAQIQIEVELAASGTPAKLREAVEKAFTLVENQSSTKSQNWFLGQSAPTFYYNVVPRRRGTPFYAQAFVDVEADEDLDELVNKLQEQVNQGIRDARVIVRKLEQGPPFDAPVEVRLVGNNLNTASELGTELRQLFTDVPDVVHTRSDLGDTLINIDFELERGVAQKNKVTPKAVSQLLFSALEGTEAARYFSDGEEIPVNVRVDLSNRSVLDSMAALQVSGANGPSPSSQQPRTATSQPPRPPTLGSLGEFKASSDVGSIVRLNGERVNEVKAYIRSGVLPSIVLEAFQAKLQDSNFQLPNGFRIEYGGEAEKRSQAVGTLLANAAVLFAIMLLSLVAILGSFRAAFIIASVGGLAIGLGPLALYVFQYPFGFMAIVGTMGLVGVAINDSIVVLAAIREHRESERAHKSDLVDVVVGCTRHILATTLTTMIGFLPLVISSGKFWPPLAIVISAGVGGATLLALYFVPSANRLLFGRVD